MAYLLTQILLCLALAIVVGAVIGWLINGYRAARREKKIKSELMRQSLALNQAETDNRMIEEDYRELKQQSEETLSLFKEENKQIPVLQQNLEKSQSLVRQLIQKHEIEVRDLQQEAERYHQRLRELESREKAVTRLQMELNTTRLQKQGFSSNDDSPNTEQANNATENHADSENLDSTDAVIESLLIQKEAHLKQAELQLEALADRNKQAHTASIEDNTNLKLGTHTDAHSPDANEPLSHAEVTSTGLEPPYDELSDTVDQLLANNSLQNAAIDKHQLNELSQLAEEADAALSESNEITDHTSTSIRTLTKTVGPKTDADPTATNHPIDRPESGDQLTFGTFGTSSRTDDLQRIFGIGPVTEKTLISLGITSYDQIAAFGEPEIKQVASALDIFPGRITRDNWVESAKKLLAEEKEKPQVPEHELEDA